MAMTEKYHPLESDSRSKLKQRLSLANAENRRLNADLDLERLQRSEVEIQLSEAVQQNLRDQVRISELEEILQRMSDAHLTEVDLMSDQIGNLTAENATLTEQNRIYSLKNKDLLKTIAVHRLSRIDSAKTRFYTVLAGLPIFGHRYSDLLLNLGQTFSAKRKNQRKKS